MKQTIELIENINSLSARNEWSSGALNRTPIAGTQAYYRSRIFTSLISINPLVAAAEPLLALHSYLNNLNSYKDTHKLYQMIIHEINTFETNAQNQGFRSETILLGRYVLCAILDETIIQNQWASNIEWSEQRLLNTFHREDSAEDRFFLILDRLSEDPKQYIELLELMYLCLSLGFEGKYRQLANGKTELDTIIDNLYQRIRQSRRESQPLFSLTNEAKKTNSTHKTSFKILLVRTTLATLVLMILIYLGFSYMFDSVTMPIQQQIRQLDQSTISVSTKLDTL